MNAFFHVDPPFVFFFQRLVYIVRDAPHVPDLTSDHHASTLKLHKVKSSI